MRDPDDIDDIPRIYVACLACYSAGRLHGCWFEVGTDPNDPDHLPDATILDLSLNRDFRLGWKDTFINVSLDALNVTNENAVNDAEWRQGGYGRVFSLERPRIYRLGIRFGF